MVTGVSAQGKPTPTPVEKECSTCEYYCGECCRRYPDALPRRPDYWCGEYVELSS